MSLDLIRKIGMFVHIVTQKSLIVPCSVFSRMISSSIKNMTMYKSSLDDIRPAERLDMVVDLRSDTVTKPSAEMREAMFTAEVGDDVLGEDPMVKKLEQRMAEITGKEAGLFVVSGTMGNFLSVLSHTHRRGSEILIADKSHIFCSEQANIAQFGGVNAHIVATKTDGTFCLEELQSHVRSRDFHEPSTDLLCIENTYGNYCGKVLPLDYIDKACEFAHSRGFPIHMDGARVFNASIASQVDVARIVKNVDSVSICLSKGLGAPVGTVIVGENAFVQRARRLRKGIGGGWRQAGILAAAGLYAVTNNVNRLAEDHARASYLAKEIRDLGSANIYVNMEDVQTNIIYVYVNTKRLTPVKFCERLLQVSEDEEAKIGRRICVRAFPQTPQSVRLVTHLDISDQDIKIATEKIKFIIGEFDKQS